MRCGRWKLESAHHSGAPYFYSQELMVNESCLQSFFHQAKDYSQVIHHNIPLEWTVHPTPSGYMDRYGWRKVMTQFSNIYGASPVNNQIIFFNGHDSHFNDWYPKIMQRKTSRPSYLKRVTPSMTIPITMVLTQNWRLPTTFWRLSRC